MVLTELVDPAVARTTRAADPIAVRSSTNRHRSSKLLSLQKMRFLILASRSKMADLRISWISAILDFRGPVMGFLKNPCTTSYRSSKDTVALNFLVFEKNAFLDFGVKIQDLGF